MTREAWRDFICSPNHAGRHLSGIGRGIAGSTGEAVDLGALQAFLERLRGIDDVRFLGNVVDLLTGGYLQFVRGPLRRILDELSSERLSRQEVVGPGLRGNPRWDRTLIGRVSGSLPVTHFVSRTAHRSFDLPENLLLSWFVRDLAERIAAVQRRIGTEAMHPDLLATAAGCRSAADHDWFGTLPRPNRLSNAMTGAARRHRRPEYRRAAALARRSAELEADDPGSWWYNVMALLAVNWLEPVDPDDLFELYVLVLTLDVLADEVGLGDPVEYGLVTTGRGRIASFERDDLRVQVFFDQTPASVLSMKTAYGSVVGSHGGVPGAERRPDVLLVVDRLGERRLVVVEAKKTRDGRYMSDSVYKVFGYVHDFSRGGLTCDGLLMVPTGVTASSAPGSEFPIRIASGDDRIGTAAALAALVRPQSVPRGGAVDGHADA